MVDISTRGFVGIKKDRKITGKFNHWDSYYSQLGKKVVNVYFDGGDILDLSDEQLEEENLFLYDGLYCEYGYVHNQDDDTLEIYRGFFKKPQVFSQHFYSYDKLYYYTHLITIIDKKKHTKEDVIKMFDDYAKASQEDENFDEDEYYERKFINVCNFCFKNLPVGKEYCNKRCKENDEKRMVVNRLIGC